MNEDRIRNGLIVAVALTLGYAAISQTEETCPDCKPSPVSPVAPKTPPPKRPDDPKPKPKPWGSSTEAVVSPRANVDANCLESGTLVSTRKGQVAIRDLDPDVHEIEYFTKSWDRRFTRRYRVFKTASVKRLWELRLKNGLYLRGTSDHQIAYLSSEKEGKFVRFVELRLIDTYRSYRVLGFLTRPIADGLRDSSVEYVGGESCKPVDVPATDVWDVKNDEDDCVHGEGNFFANNILVHNCNGHSALVGKPVLGGQVGPNGQEVHIDLPLSQRIRNIGSHVDGAGMCVSTSMTHAARWHAMRDWYNWRDWCAKFPGGGYPSKMDKQIKQFSDEKKIPAPPYLQYEGKDASILEEAFRAGLLPSVTYSGRDGVRYSGSIAHMVNLVYLDDKSAAIMDNNGKPEDLIWMSRDEFIDRWTGGRSGWAHFWLLPGPPPPPRNLSKNEVVAYYSSER